MARRTEHKELHREGSFEKTDIERNPVGWALGGVDGLRFEIDEEVKYSGHQSLRITGNGIKLPQRGGVYPGRDILVPANRVYNLEVWIKAKDVEFGRSAPLDGGYLSHLGRFIDGNYSGNSSLAIPEGTYDWTRFSFVHKWKGESLVPEPYRALVPTIMRGKMPDAFNGTLWIDGVSLHEIEVISAYQSVATPKLVDHYKNAVKTPDGSLSVLFAAPTKKILRGMTLDNVSLKGGSTGSISLAKNEHEGIQIVVASLWDKEVTKTLEVSVAPLRNAQTGRIPDDIRVTWNPWAT